MSRIVLSCLARSGRRALPSSGCFAPPGAAALPRGVLGSGLGSGLGFRGGLIPGTGGRLLSAAAGGGGRGPEEEKGEREGPAAAAAAAAPGAASPVVMKDVSVNQSKPWLADLGLPSLLPEYAKMLSPSTVFTDIAAGITVGCIAVPLSLAIAVASDVPPEVGLVTAAVSGVAGGLFGGTTLAITGPAAAISLLVIFKNGNQHARDG